MPVNGHPIIPPASRPIWANKLGFKTYYVGRWVYGDDATYCKTWDYGGGIIQWGVEDWNDMDFDDFVFKTEIVGADLRITIVSFSAAGQCDLYWDGVLKLANVSAHVGETVTVPAPYTVVDIYDSFMLAGKQDEPLDPGGYWIFGHWVRKVRARYDKIASQDHNLPKLILEMCRDQVYKAETGTL
jgi:hypothetical protein